MIERTASFKTSDGEIFPTLEAAQTSEIANIIGPAPYAKDVAITIVTNAEKVIDILTTTPTSKPRARKVNGGTKKRKASVPAEVSVPA